MGNRTVVTISRQLGCGGAQVGQFLAARLGFRYADREILRLAARALTTREEDISWREERPSTFWEKLTLPFAYGSPDAPYIPPPMRIITDDELFTAESGVIRDLAAECDCVVVGRGGAQILRDHPNAIHVLLHAPEAARVRRVMEVYSVADVGEALRTVRQADSERQAFHQRLGHMDWLGARNYHISLDTSVISIDQVVDLLAAFVHAGAGGPAAAAP